MIERGGLNFINEVLSAIDSFQQDYGRFRYSVTIQSYALCHQLTVSITDTESSGAVRFVIEQTLYEQARVPSRYIYDLIKERSESLVRREQEQ